MEYFRLHLFRQKLIATAATVAVSVPNVVIGAVCTAFMVFALATPAAAQVTIQFGDREVPGFSSNYPWFNDVPQYQGDQSFRYFMAYHPDIAQALAQNPAQLYDANWRSQFPALEQYLANHPYEWQALNGEYWSEGPAQTQWGDYDNGQWRDAYWWHQNNPNWFYENHLNWASLDSRWLNEDGAYDDQNQWHYGEWWYNQNPSWVSSNHPTWLVQHQNWTTSTEQQQFRQQQAMIGHNQALSIQPQQANVRQQNQQRATEQQQANLEQQHTMRQTNERQQQVNQQRMQQEQQASRERSQAIGQENQQALRQEHVTQQPRTSEVRQANAEQQQSMRQENPHQQQGGGSEYHQQQATHHEEPQRQSQNGGQQQGHGGEGHN